MIDLKQIIRPTALLDEVRAQRNIDRMVQRAVAAGSRFRPHFKTHQSVVVGDWFHSAGVRAITVSSVSMAHYFAEAGWENITIAFPVNWRELAEIEALAKRVRLGLLVESAETAIYLRDHLHTAADIWLEIDAGYHRTGILWDDTDEQLAAADAIESSPDLNLRGLLTHGGNSYSARGKAAVQAIFDETMTRIERVRDGLGRPTLELSIGDTPCCSLADGLERADELRPGNFIYYDLMQAQIGACAPDDIALAVACPVVAVYPGRGEIMLYGGAVHLSKDRITLDDNTVSYGAVVPLSAEGWQIPDKLDSVLVGLSQEHGTVRASAELLTSVKRGDLLAVLPIHSCLTANLLGNARTLSGASAPMAHFVYD